MNMENTTNDQLEQYRPETATALLNKEVWEVAQRQAMAWAKSTIIPKDYQNNMPNCLVALEMANRMGASPMMIMQNLYVVQGRPGWSSTFLIASVNHCGRFTSLRYEERGEPGEDTYAVRAWAVEKKTDERLNGTWITWDMVKAEGWLNKAGSKWKTMPDQMFKYRAASFWQRTYAPEISMGLHTVEEVEDIAAVTISPVQKSTRWSPLQMKSAQEEVEVMGKSSAAEILENNPNLPEDQKLLIQSWEFKGQEA